jgi:hypothetical protein
LWLPRSIPRRECGDGKKASSRTKKTPRGKSPLAASFGGWEVPGVSPEGPGGGAARSGGAPAARSGCRRRGDDGPYASESRPSRQAWVDLQRLQIRLCGPVEAKVSPHIRHLRFAAWDRVVLVVSSSRTGVSILPIVGTRSRWGFRWRAPYGRNATKRWRLRRELKNPYFTNTCCIAKKSVDGVGGSLYHRRRATLPQRSAAHLEGWE